MYRVDFEIVGFKRTLDILEEEKEKIDALSEAEKSNFKLDPRKFNKLRMKQIENIYGELGQHMLMMLPQKPSKAIPILYQRFKMNYERRRQERDECVKDWHN